MRLKCPLCGDRDAREFHYRGAAKLMERPEAGAGEAAFYDYVYLRENPVGANSELWFHELGCRAWLCVSRDVSSHEILSVELADAVKRGQA
ncbi:MAG: sarcosine oxidase subunit delta [Alphaproteobacteria bacterium]|nr:sarcosine oxidase subunit delta [Alphaproteobacteria bacterium]